MVLPARTPVRSIGATNGVNQLKFSRLDELIAFANGATNGATTGAGHTASAIIHDQIHDRVAELLNHSMEWINRSELFEKVSLSNQSVNRKKYLDPILTNGWLQLEYPDNKTHPKQRYRITEAGERIRTVLGE